MCEKKKACKCKCIIFPGCILLLIIISVIFDSGIKDVCKKWRKYEKQEKEKIENRENKEEEDCCY